MIEEIDTNEEAVAESWQVDDLASAEWAMRKVAKATKEIADIDAAAQQWHQEIDDWRDKVAKRPNQTIEFFSEHLARYARKAREADEDNKTLVLPSGEVRTRSSKEKIIVADKTAVLEWARTAAPEAIKITESLLVSELAHHVAIRHAEGADGQPILVERSSGEIVAGLSLAPASLSVTVVPTSTRSGSADKEAS